MFSPDKRLKRLYDKYNALYFDGELPAYVQVGWNDLAESDTSLDEGCTHIEREENGDYHFRISINVRLKGFTWADVKGTVLHEMAHIKLTPYTSHGKKFQEEMLRLAVRGAFEEIW